MKREIRQRIEQIRRGEVPDGYKKMKNNILPSDWYKTALEAAVNFLDEKRIPIKENERVAGNYPYYGASGIIDYVHDYIFDGEYILLGEDGANIIDRSSPLAFRVSGKCWVNNHAHVLEPKNGFDIDYLTQYLENLSYDRYNSGTAQPKLNQETCRKIVIIHPSFSEQQKIAKILTTQDKVIELYEKKIEQLQLLKKVCLQKMFPKEGSSVPELRFPGFTEPWEQHELGKCCEITTGGTPTTSIIEYWNPKEIPWLSSGEVHKKRISYTDDKISSKGLENSSARWVKPYSVLIALAGQGKTRGTVAINEIAITTNQSIAAIYPIKHDTEFLYQNLESRYEELRSISSGDGARGGLNKHILSSIFLPYTEKSEQQKIGSYLYKLDYLIKLHQLLLDEEKKYKKILLQLLMTGIVRV